MMSSVDVKNGAGAIVTSLKLGARAMVKLERAHEKPIHEVLKGMDSGGSVELVAEIVAVAMNGGIGGSEDDAFDVMDVCERYWWTVCMTKQPKQVPKSSSNKRPTSFVCWCRSIP